MRLPHPFASLWKQLPEVEFEAEFQKDTAALCQEWQSIFPFSPLCHIECCPEGALDLQEGLSELCMGVALKHPDVCTRKTLLSSVSLAQSRKQLCKWAILKITLFLCTLDLFSYYFMAWVEQLSTVYSLGQGKNQIYCCPFCCISSQPWMKLFGNSCKQYLLWHSFILLMAVVLLPQQTHLRTNLATIIIYQRLTYTSCSFTKYCFLKKYYLF